MESGQPTSVTLDEASERSALVAPIRDVKLPAHIVEERDTELDEERLHERAERYRYRDEGGAYKGHVRGMLTGSFLGAGFGGIMGGITYAALAAFSAVSLPALPVVLGAFVASGIFIGAKGFGQVGSSAGAMSYNLAEKHARKLIRSTILYKGKGADNELDEASFEGRYGHHFEVPPDRDSGMLYHWKSGMIGTAIGGLVGGATWLGAGMLPIAELFSASAAAPALHALGHGAAMTMLTGVLGAAAAPVAAIGAFALLGATFGINRSVFRSVFNITDGWLKGKTDGNTLPTIEKELEKARSPEERERMKVKLKAEYETALRRQEKIHELDEKYFKKLFWHSVGGRLGGLMGGTVVGSSVGALAGLGVAALILAATTTVAAGVLIPALMMGGMAVGGLMGQEIFTETGTASGTTSMSKAIDEEFERGRALKAKGIAPNATKMPKEKGIFDGKALVLCTVVGLALGLTAAPLLAGSAFATGLLGATFAESGVAIAGLSSAIGGFFGSLYGIRSKVFQAVGDFASNLYFGNVFGKNGTEYAHEHEKNHIPESSLLRPASSRGAMEIITDDDMAKLSAKKNEMAIPFTNRINTPSLSTTPLMGK